MGAGAFGFSCRRKGTLVFTQGIHMKKNRSGKRQNKPAKKTSKQDHDIEAPERRNALRLIRNGTVGITALGGIGWWAVSGVRAVAEEQDLSTLGTGLPSIVQIHDPSCSMCTELQRETREALECFDDAQILYKVANIRTSEGSAFSARLGLSHVTLVLMDGQGGVKDILQGVRKSDELKDAFEVQFPGTRLG